MSLFSSFANDRSHNRIVKYKRVLKSAHLPVRVMGYNQWHCRSQIWATRYDPKANVTAQLSELINKSMHILPTTLQLSEYYSYHCDTRNIWDDPYRKSSENTTLVLNDR